MGLRRVEDFYAFQLAVRFSECVLQLVRASPAAMRDFRLRDQLLDAADSAPSDITEGFSRCNPGDFARFLDYAMGSLAEAERWLKAGIARGYFDPAACETPLRYKRRAWKAALNLKQSQVREAARRRAAKRPPRRPQQNGKRPT